MDLLDDIIGQLAATVPDYPADKLRAAAVKIRADIGGSEAYIKKAPAEGKAHDLGNALAAGVPFSQACDEVGVSRYYGYRLVRRLARRAA